MKIDFSACRYDAIDCGICFRWLLGTEVYLKTNVDEADDSTNKMAVNLESGALVIIPRNALVIPYYDAEIININ